MSYTCLLFLFFGICSLGISRVSAMGPTPFGQQKANVHFDSKDKKAPRKNPLLKKSFEQLKIGKQTALKNNDFETAAKHLDAMRIKCADDEKTWEQHKDILLEMADVYYQQEDWTKSEKAYQEFLLLYPSAANVDYAHYKLIVSSFNLTLSFDRDQTKTEETIKLCKEFNQKYATSEHRDAVANLLNQCYEKSMHSEIGIFNFYFNNKNFKAAHIRLNSIFVDQIPHIPSFEPNALELSIRLAQAENDLPTSLQKQLELSMKFPDHDITQRWVPDVANVKLQLAQLEQKSLETTPIA